MNEIQNCPICGRLYKTNPFGMCEICRRKEEDDEMTVANYVREHPNCSIQKIHEETGVRKKTILRMIQSGRLIEIGAVTYECESCGAPITSGRLCAICNKKLLQDIQAQEKNLVQKKIQSQNKGVGFLANYYKKTTK